METSQQKLDLDTVQKLLNDLELIDNTYFQKDRATKMRTIHDQIIGMLDEDALLINIENK